MGAATAMEAVVEATAAAVVVAAATAAADTGYDREMSDFSHSRSLIMKKKIFLSGWRLLRGPHAHQTLALIQTSSLPHHRRRFKKPKTQFKNPTPFENKEFICQPPSRIPRARARHTKIL